MLLRKRTLNGAYNGLSSKVRFIQSCYTTSLSDPRVRAYAERAAGRGDRLTQARRLFENLREVMVYTRDPVGAEMTKSPSRHLDDILSRGKAYGDCDDHACVAYAMLQSIGLPAKLRVTWLGRDMPQHIYVITQVDGKWIPFDTTRKAGFGNEASYTKVMDF